MLLDYKLKELIVKCRRIQVQEHSHLVEPLLHTQPLLPPSRVFPLNVISNVVHI